MRGRPATESLPPEYFKQLGFTDSFPWCLDTHLFVHSQGPVEWGELVHWNLGYCLQRHSVSTSLLHQVMKDSRIEVWYAQDALSLFTPQPVSPRRRLSTPIPSTLEQAGISPSLLVVPTCTHHLKLHQFAREPTLPLERGLPQDRGIRMGCMGQWKIKQWKSMGAIVSCAPDSVPQFSFSGDFGDFGTLLLPEVRTL